MSTPPRTADDLGPAIDAAGKYRLGPLLGAGGMAEVYRGYIAGAEGFERQVAIKRVLASYSADERFAAMFISEARLASLLSHPCVVSVIDFNRDREGRLFQIIEFVNGVDLEKLAPPGEPAGMAEAVIIYVITEVLEGLRHAHLATDPHSGKALGIVHRDCTPSNVLITWDGVVKLSDFGIAKAMQATHATASGTAKGKPTYMAPEQITAEHMDARVDLFAVGAMLWELLTGQRPFGGDDAMAVMFRVSQYGQHQFPVATPHELTGGRAPVALSNLAMRLMAPRPAERPASAQEALAELRSCGRVATRDELAQLLADRYPTRAPRTSAAFVSAPPAHSLPTNVAVARAGGSAGTVGGTIGRTPQPVGDLAPSSAPPRSRRALALALGAGAIVLGATLTIALSSGDERRGAAPTGTPAPLVDAAAAPVAAPATLGADAAAPDRAAMPVDRLPGSGATVVDAGTAAATTAPPAAVRPPPLDAGPAIEGPPVDAAPPVDAGRKRRPGSTRPPPGTGSGSSHGFVEKVIGEGT